MINLLDSEDNPLPSAAIHTLICHVLSFLRILIAGLFHRMSVKKNYFTCTIF